MTEPKPGPCQVRSRTDSPCPRTAEVEILGVAFCGPCARQQKAYFAIGELADEEAQNFCSEALAEELERMRRGRVGRTGGIAGEIQHGHLGVHQNESLALRSG